MQEHLCDCMLLVDMVLEYYLDKRTKEDEGLVFSRAAKLEAQNVEEYFFTEPSMRYLRTDFSDAKKNTRLALEYIHERENNTSCYLPLKEIRGVFDMSEVMFLIFLVSLSVHVAERYAPVYGYIGRDSRLLFPTIGVGLTLAEVMFDDVPTADEIRSSVFIRTFFYPMRDESAALMPLSLHKMAISYVFNKEMVPDGLLFRIYKEKINAPVFFDDTFDKLYDVITDEDDELPFFMKSKDKKNIKDSGCIYIESEDKADVFHLLYKLSEKKNQKFYIIEVERLSRRLKGTYSKEDALTCMQEAGIFLMTNPGILVVDFVRPEGEKTPEYVHRMSVFTFLLSYLKEILPNDVIYICGEKKMPMLTFRQETMFSPFTLEKPDVSIRIAIWNHYINELSLKVSEDINIDDISDCYELSFGQILSMIDMAVELMKVEKADKLTRDMLLSLLFRQNAENFGSMASRIAAKYTWDDLEIDPSQRKILGIACDRYRHRNRLDREMGIGRSNAYGNGVSVLLYGPPGTGKTMAAQVIANETGIELFRVDTARIFSKYVGETEKNLAQIFNEASKTNVILFFDEADALFSKRTEVSDSHDKYSNAETSYLLQKIEEYNGITILATNLFRNFDNAFIRRLTYVVRMDNPNVDTRERLWQNVLPESVKMEKGIDFAFLAERFELSGSNIKSIMLSAAYMAGARDSVLSAADIVLAMKYEFDKLGKIIDPSEFGKYAMYLHR